MTSHFAGIATLMTIRVQRLDPPWRAYMAAKRPARGDAQGINFTGLGRKTAPLALALAAAAVSPLLAHAAGGVSPAPAPVQQTQEAPAQTESAPAQAEKAPAVRGSGGMVRYDRPVFHNGHRVLWHGAWRGGGGAPMASAPKPTATGASAEAAAAATGGAKPRDLVILADSADPSATRMASEFADAVQSDNVHVKAVPGKTSVAALDKAVSSDAADFAIVSVDILTDKGAAGWRDRAPYIARLANEPIALIAPRAITDISQLSGRKVNVDSADSATAATAGIVFSRLNVAPKTANEHLPDALAHLASGQIDAVFVVGVNDAKALADFGKDGKFHIVAIPYASALQATYCPMRLTAHEQPNLIGAGEKIDTIGAPTALVAIDVAPNSPRADRVAPAANLFFDQFDQLLGSSSNSNWREINLAAQLGGWPRLGATQAWLDQNKGAPNAALDNFRTMAQTAAAASEGPSGADSDRLYQSLMQASGAAQ
jgi:TRAP-type uncharacterized transport system substrate-binding protein